MDEDYEDFQFKFRLLYHESVEPVLYKFEKLDPTLPEHSLQIRTANGEESAICLLCKSILKGPLNEAVLLEHIYSLIHKYFTNLNAFDAYHRIFLSLSADNQFKQINYIPHDAENVKCELCSKTINTKYLLEHIGICPVNDEDVEAIPETVSNLVVEQSENTTASIDYSQLNSNDVLLENLKILANTESICPVNDEDVEEIPETVSNRVVEQSENTTASIDYSQFNSNDVSLENLKILANTESPLIVSTVGIRKLCILCNALCQDVSYHLQSEKHQILINNPLKLQRLSVYHLFWIKQNSTIKKYQRYFTAKSKNRCCCILCNRGFSYKNFYKEIKDFPCCFLSEGDAFFDDHLNWKQLRTQFVEDNLRNIPEYGEAKVVLYPDHILKEINKVECLPIFTVQWQLDTTKCLVCNIPPLDLVTLEDIKAHVLTKEHKNCVSKKKNLLALAAYHTFWSTCESEAQLKQHKFLSSNLKNARCSICRRNVPYILSHIQTHLESGCNPKFNYIKANNECDDSSDADSVETETHETTEPQSDVVGPCYSTVLQVISPNKLHCLCCRARVIGPAEMHLKAKEHLNNYDKSMHIVIMAYHQFWGKQTQEDQAKQLDYFPKSNENVTCKICKIEISYSDILEHHCQNADSQQLSTTINEAVFVENSLHISNAKDNECTSYTRDLLVKIYPHNASRKPKEVHNLCIQKRAHSTFCLCCNIQLFGNVTSHNTQRKHVMNFERREIKEILTMYHNYWLAQSPEKQLHQVYYNLCTSNIMICAICQKEIPFEMICTHSCSLKFENTLALGAVSEEFQNVEFNYDVKVKQKFYSRTMMEVTGNLLKTNMPVCMHWNNIMKCLLCHGRITRSEPVWQQHLLDYHIKQTQVREKNLQNVLSFHKFWVSQCPEDQYIQIFYLPIDNSQFRCNKNHRVEQQNALQHYRECGMGTDAKLEKTFLVEVNSSEVKNITESIQEKFEAISINNALSSTSIPHSNVEVKIQSPRFIGQSTSNGFSKKKEKTEHTIKHVSEVMNETPIQTPTEIENSVLQQSNVTKQITKLPKKDGASAKDTPHIVFKSIPNRNTTNLLLQLPERLLAHRKYLLMGTDKVKCTACNEILAADICRLHNHITNKKHLNVTKLDKERFKFFCEICRNQSYNEFEWWKHLYDNVAHKTKINNLGQTRRAQMEEHFCKTCNSVIFGDELSVIRHQQLNVFKPPRKNDYGATKLPQQVLKMLGSVENVEEEANKQLVDSNNAKAEEFLVQKCIEAFEDAVRCVYPDCKGYAFGSRMTYTGGIDSDLDIFLDVGGMYNGTKQQESKDQQIILKTVNKLLDKNKDFSDIFPITSARTPIIRVIHNITKIDCDVSFRHALGVENSKYIRFCLELQPKARAALLILKHWASLISLKEEITSYALYMMFIFNLQLKKYLIPVHRMRELTTADVKIIDGWHTINYGDTSIDTFQEHIVIFEGNYHSLVKEFFLMYSNFDFATNLISPILGRVVPIYLFDVEKGNLLPNEMSMYKEKYSRGECEFRSRSAMCVQDPFDLGHNLTKAVGKPFCDKFKKLCKLSYERMQQAN